MFVQVLASTALVLAATAGGCDPNMGDTGTPGGTAAEQTVTFRVTGYSSADNNPAGSATISMPTIHQQAGGAGTFDDPVTAASPGHAGSTEFPAGTKFYIPELSRYVIVEDSGASKFSQPHLDVWVGVASNAAHCEDAITGTFPVIENPGPDHPVKAGPIATGTACDI